tara:strand:+ start:603 stop:722 length:120 start_codon:yes stop_codon:yes gene_type:complete
MIDKMLLKFFDFLDNINEKLNDVLTFDVGQENKKRKKKK